MLVYVAGPYTAPDPAVNVRRAIDAAERLIAVGHTPYVPHLCHVWHLISPHEYRYWISYNLKVLEKCDALLRIPGDSPGAEEEVVHAKLLGIPVYHRLMDLQLGDNGTRS